MKREIKFRAWDKDKKEMFIAKYISGEGEPCKYEIMQFTGLKDFKRKEVFEGDIVKVTGCDFYFNNSFSTEPEDKEEWEYIGVVEQNSFMWLVSGLVSGGMGKTWIPLCDILAEDLSIEVIGNIHEHSHLLKGEKLL